MTKEVNLEDFENEVRAALRSVEPAPPLDPSRIMRHGRRIRYRRRALVGGAVIGATAAVTIPMTLTQLGPPAITATGASASPSVSPSGDTAAADGYSCPEPGVRRNARDGSVPLTENWTGGSLVKAFPYGNVICTGEFGSKGEAVFYFQRDKGLSGGTVASIWEGRRDSAGRYSGYFRGRDHDFTAPKSKDLTPGLHSLSGDGFDNFVFGYYVGPAASVEVTVLGKKMPARLERWDQNENISYFWFRFSPGTDRMRVYNSIESQPGDVKIVVRDADGTQLPLGDQTIAAM